MSTKPEVSILLPTYNRAYSITNAIESVMNQTFTDWELLIIDDKSTDNTAELIDQFSSKDSRIKYIYNDGTKGVSGARNTGLRNISGNYIAFIDSDDEWYEFHLEQSLRVLKSENLKVSFSFWDSCLDGIKSCFLELPEEAKICSDTVKNLNAKETDEYYVFGTNFYEYHFTSDLYCYVINTMVIHKEVFDKTGFFNEKLNIHEDTDFSIRIFKNYGFSLIKKSSFVYNMGNNDHLFGFLDRCDLVRKLHEMKHPLEIITKKELFQLLRSSYSTVKFVELRLKYIKQFPDKKLRNKSLKELKRRGAVFCFTLGYLSSSVNFKDTIYYFFNSLKFNWDKLTAAYILKSIMPFMFPQIQKREHKLSLHT